MATICSLRCSKPKAQAPSAEAEELLLRFLSRVLLWLRTNHARIVNLFRKFDSDQDNELSVDDFFVAMRMMDVSCCMGSGVYNGEKLGVAWG